jgi:prepilin signal peptidase PulO-like enzyme (type II secretory pathway)
VNALQHLAWAQSLTGLAFLFAFGAIVGSFLNVVVYRLPLGKGIVTPPSACPACDTPLRWNDNIPILGWFLLRGRCRYCKTRISPEYMIVELLVALTFACIAAAWFLRPSPLELLGLDLKSIRPDWTLDGLARMWPMLGQIYLLIAALVAITLIDARTFMIPLVLPWLVTGVAFVAHPAHAAWIGAHGGLRRSPFPWTIATPTGPWLIATLAGALGLVIALILLQLRIIPRSFADYDQWEKDTAAQREAAALAASTSSAPSPAAHDTAIGPTFRRVFLLTGPALALMFLGFSLGLPMDRPFHGMAIGMALGLLIGIVLRRLSGRAGAPSNEPVWLAYPHARREMLKELLFLAPPIAAFALAWYLATTRGVPPLAAEPPLWLAALTGSLLGYLIGAAVVWAVRILGSLAFGKEAMGLGDVHLMGAVGAVLGWIDATLAFFLAPALGLAWVVLAWALAKSRGRAGTGSALPFGPHLAAASLLVLLAKPAAETILALILSRPINLP